MSTRKVRTQEAPTYTPGFLQFWSDYPPARRASKPSCQKVWLVANLEPRTDELCEKIARLKITSWQDIAPNFIPLTTTWLNQGRYEDELVPLPAKPGEWAWVKEVEEEEARRARS